MNRIPLARPNFSERAIAAAGDTLRSGWPGPGPKTAEFEWAFAGYVAADHVVAVNSGTAALHLAIRLLDLPAGSEVITTANTFVATNQALLYEGLTPVFADIEPRTGNICVDSIAQRIGPRTAAIMVVHYGGYPCDLDALYALAVKCRLPVIEDCAHATGASYHGVPVGAAVGSEGPVVVQAFSFNTTKNLAMVDGGAICLPDAALADRGRRLRWMGIDRNTHERMSADGYQAAYDVAEVGYRYAMNDLHAALGLIGLEEIAATNAERRHIAARYQEGLTRIPGVEPLDAEPGRTSSYYLYPVLMDRRDRVRSHLAEAGIETGVHYIPNTRYPMFAEPDPPAAATFAERSLSLPMFAGLEDADVDRILEALARAAGA